MTVDKAMNLIQGTSFIDINGSSHEVKSFFVDSSEFSLCDPKGETVLTEFSLERLVYSFLSKNLFLLLEVSYKTTFLFLTTFC